MANGKRVPARYYARLCEVLEQLGVDPDPLLSQAGIARDELNAADGTLTLSQIDALIHEAARASGRGDLGLELAKALKLTSHSAVSYGILSSPNVGYALRLVARFFSLILPSFRMRCAMDTTSFRLTVVPIWPMSRTSLAFHLELIGAAVHWELRDLVGTSLPPYDICFSLDQPPHAACYEQFREARVQFGWRTRPGLRMQWPARLASLQPALSDPTALELAEQRCRDMVNKARATGNVAEWVHMMLREASGGPPGMSELANALNLSPRTLDRYLEKEGASYRTLSKQVCHAKACELLREHRLSITQIALELGYTDASNFARAFRSYSGLSPGKWQGQNPLFLSRASK